MMIVGATWGVPYRCLEISHRGLVVGGLCSASRLDRVESLTSGSEQIVEVIGGITDRGAREESRGWSGGHVAEEVKSWEWEREMGRRAGSRS